MSKYIDKWGDNWERMGWYLVVRRKDDNLGGWYDGQGLEEL